MMCAIYLPMKVDALDSKLYHPSKRTILDCALESETIYQTKFVRRKTRISYDNFLTVSDQRFVFDVAFDALVPAAGNHVVFKEHGEVGCEYRFLLTVSQGLAQVGDFVVQDEDEVFVCGCSHWSHFLDRHSDVVSLSFI